MKFHSNSQASQGDNFQLRPPLLKPVISLRDLWLFVCDSCVIHFDVRECFSLCSPRLTARSTRRRGGKQNQSDGVISSDILTLGYALRTWLCSVISLFLLKILSHTATPSVPSTLLVISTPLFASSKFGSCATITLYNCRISP